MQKLLFLISQRQDDPSFDFVPYKMGCFSFQSYADIRTMVKYNMVTESNDHIIKTDKNLYTDTLTAKDKQILLYIKAQFKKPTGDDLISYTYKKYPYYATKSTIAHKVLTAAELALVHATIPKNNSTTLYTIGYEGVSLENYLNKLILNDVKLLCDVRKNSFSMKYGFSKSQLKYACEQVGIEFIHIPSLGISSDKRQSLTTQDDYDYLFREYEQTTLVHEKNTIYTVLQLLKKNKRIALTCFEASQCQCHRGTLAKAITGLPEWKYELKHL